MKRYVKLLIIAAIIVLVVLAGVWVYKSFLAKPKYNGPSVPPIKISYANLASELGKLQLVWAIPKDGSVILEFYNFNSGSRQIEKSYLFTTGNAKEVPVDSSADIVMSIHSKYLADLTNQNLCTIVQKAKAAGDFGTETQLSKTALAWKYRSLLSYKDCLGI